MFENIRAGGLSMEKQGRVNISENLAFFSEDNKPRNLEMQSLRVDLIKTKYLKFENTFADFALLSTIWLAGSCNTKTEFQILLEIYFNDQVKRVHDQ